MLWLTTKGAELGLKVLAALAMWILGRWIVGIVLRIFEKAINKTGRIEPTLARYLVSIIGVLLNIVLILAILDIFGVQTTSFAALLAGAGLAIGTACGGLLSHFAAGAFLQVLRPYKVGDYISAGGVEGTVKELGLFGTTVVSGDSVTNIVGNNKIFSDTIKNYSALPQRRVDCEAKVANGVDLNDAVARLKAALPVIKNVLKEPAPEVEISKFHRRRTAVDCARLLSHRSLLAGLLRYQQGYRLRIWHGGVSCPRDALRAAAGLDDAVGAFHCNRLQGNKLLFRTDFLLAYFAKSDACMKALGLRIRRVYVEFASNRLAAVALGKREQVAVEQTSRASSLHGRRHNHAINVQQLRVPL